ncbi:MAG: U32 family peptidase [Clostridia bacterium]|nr:U32 family peptidase [Clostridia bacterium]
MLELLAPAGNMDKLKTAIYYGADACYFAGTKYGLRAYAGNFTDEDLIESVDYAHSLGKKAYVTVNIIAHNVDFAEMEEYIKFLHKIKVDAVIVADVGIISLIRRVCPELDVHVSTQANITNKYSAKFFCDMGVKRLVLARELSVAEIKEIREYIPQDVEIEAFVHGAMCISYSGRCLLSNYLCNRDSNKGACVQACRWEYTIHEKSRDNEEYPIYEDSRGTYILNSKDLNMLAHIQELYDAGVTSLKIEGRMKSVYYVATVVNAYRRAIDMLGTNKSVAPLLEELNKTSHRNYTTGFYYGSNNKECLESSTPVQTHEFMAVVLGPGKDGRVLIEQRNRFKVGDVLEVLSPTDTFNKQIEVTPMLNEKGEEVVDALGVQQKLYLKTKLKLQAGDILRKKI